MEKNVPLRCQMSFYQHTSVGWCELSGVLAGDEFLENLILVGVLNRTAYRVRQARQS